MTRGAMLLMDADFSWATFDSSLSLELLDDLDFLLWDEDFLEEVSFGVI